MNHHSIVHPPAAGPVPATEIITEPDGRRIELTDIPLAPPRFDRPHNKIVRGPDIARATDAERGTLLSIFHILFVDEYQRLRFGPCIEGAVFELELPGPAELSYLDGYLTVQMQVGSAHFHLCIGEQRGLKTPIPPDVAIRRRCARAAFTRSLGATSCTPGSWGLRLWNGAGDQMLTVFLPSPFLDDDLKRLREPDWARLELWNRLRVRFLEETTPQPIPA